MSSKKLIDSLIDGAKRAERSTRDFARTASRTIPERAATATEAARSAVENADGPLGDLLDALANKGGSPRRQAAMYCDAVGDEFFRHVSEHLVVDTDWPAEAARRVAGQLNRVRHPKRKLSPVVIWSSRVTAFTLPGTRVYITRELLQRLRTDDALAFILAHEMAHHDLHHLEAHEAVEDLAQFGPRAALLAILASSTLRLGARPEAELAADRLALDVCLRAGFDRDACLGALAVLERHLVDVGALDLVFGVQGDPDASKWADLAQKWFFERRTLYPSIRDRVEALRR